MADGGLLIGALVVGTVASIAGTAISVDASNQAARVQRLLSEDQRRQNDIQAILASQANNRVISQIEEVAGNEKSKLAQRAAILKARGRAEFAAGNVQLGSGGTTVDWERDLAFATELDLGAIDTEAKRQQSEAEIGGADALRLSFSRSQRLINEVATIKPALRRRQAGTIIGGVGQVAGFGTTAGLALLKK